MDRTLDCCGLACPAPVLETKAALEKGGRGVLTVRLDSVASRENVARFARSQGFSVDSKDQGSNVWELKISRGDRQKIEDPSPRRAGGEPDRAVAMLITNQSLGADAALGAVLMKAFLGTLKEATRRPARLLFLNTGVRLTSTGSEVLDVLEELQREGVEILSCGTCLEFFGLRDALQVGTVTNMYDTVEVLTGDFRVVTVS